MDFSTPGCEAFTLDSSSGTASTPTIAKSFSPNLVGVGESSTLTFTITNPTAAALTNVGFIDNYPGDIENVDPMEVSNTCGGSLSGAGLGNSISLTGGEIPAGGSCQVSVKVVGFTSGTYTNTSEALTWGSGSRGNQAVANLQIKILPPRITKSFSPPTISVNGGISALTFRIDNPNINNALTGISFSDTYPAGVINATPLDVSNTCGGTVTASAGGNGIALSGAARPPGGWCTLTVLVTATGVGSPYTNTTSVITANETSEAGAAATASLTVLDVPVCTFSSVGLSKNANIITWTIENTSPAAVAQIYNLGSSWNTALYLKDITIDGGTPLFYGPPDPAVPGPPFPAIQDFMPTGGGVFNLAPGAHTIAFKFCRYSDCHGLNNITAGSQFRFAVRFSTSGCTPLASGDWTAP